MASHKVMKNKAIFQVLTPASEVLGRIQEDFHTMLRAREKEGHSAIEITCFYEEVPHWAVPKVSIAIPLIIIHGVIL